MRTIKETLDLLCQSVREYGLRCNYRYDDDNDQAQFWIGERGNGGEVRFALRADSLETLDAIRQQPKLLADCLETIGMNVVDLSVRDGCLHWKSKLNRLAKQRREFYARARKSGRSIARSWLS